eukprot:gene21377-22227_t
MNAAVAEKNLSTPASHERGLLRFITAGSVDDGKSTLIGRLLFDSKGIFADQLDAMSRAKHKRTVGDTIDLSLLTDGLEAEREQGITIDVAYRYFATPKRKFIIADTPGHEQYTRNMVTGASTADAVIILIDVSKVKLGDDGSVELLIQTKRHSTIAHLLQIQHVVVAVNKMDLIDYDQGIYNRIVGAYQQFAAELGLKDVRPIPLSALAGDNVVSRGEKLSWYQGPTLIELLESLSVYEDAHAEPFRFPVQLVARHNGHEANDFRGYMGRIEAGKVRQGDKLVVQPSGQSATVKEILTLDGPLAEASAGQSVTILLNEYLDISRGDMLASAEQAPTLLKTINADLCWLSEETLDPRRKYWLKHTTKQVAARVAKVDTLLDINTQQRHAAESLKLNDIARVTINVQQAIAADSYDDIRATGAFILIDEVSHQTSAAAVAAAVPGCQLHHCDRMHLQTSPLPVPSTVTPVGKVYLIGAGPGAADLITVRGARLLAQAEVVLHDALVSDEMLALCPQAVKIAVGKRSGQRSTAQQEINQRLIECAQQYRTAPDEPSEFIMPNGDTLVQYMGGREATATAQRLLSLGYARTTPVV